jgi:prepilin-type N-terminal cleavage/methylation domain-containing protein
MKGCRQPSGFTVVEVMIVLAVSALLFLAAALMIGGKQNRTGFTTSINDFQAEMQQVANDVINGYYPKFSNFSCTQGSPNTQPTIAAGSNNQGTNGGLNSSDTLSGCTFLGKAVQFAVSSSGDSSSPLIYVYPVIGNLGGSDNLPTQSISDGYPELLAPSGPTGNINSFASEFIEPYDLQYGLYVAWMCYSISSNSCSNIPADATAVVVFATSPTASNGGTTLSSGGQELEFIPIPSASLDLSPSNGLGASSQNMITQVNNYFANPSGNVLTVNPSGGVQICLADKTTDESGLLTIGGNNGQSSINLNVINGSVNCS